MSKLETNTIDTISGTSNLTIGGANNTGTTTIKTNNTDAVTIDNSQNLKFNSGYGSVATAYGCRAWVNFNGVGTVAINGVSVDYTPAANFNGEVTITYTVSDGTLTDEGTLTITVTPGNDAPVAVADTATTSR